MACSSKKGTNDSTKESNNNSLADNIENFSKLQEVTDDYTKRAEELKKLTPVSSDGLKSIFKESVLAIKRTDFSVQNVVGYAMGEANYKINIVHLTKLQLMIVPAKLALAC